MLGQALKAVWQYTCCVYWCMLVVVAAEKMLDVPLVSFKSADVEYQRGADSVSLGWTYEPRNASVFWLRFFYGKNKWNMKHFFTYSQVTAKARRRLNIGNRTTINIVKEEMANIRLKIDQPISLDDGLYCCELEGAFVTMTACLHLEGNSVSTTEMNTAPKATSNTTFPGNTVTEKGQENSHIPWIIMGVVALCTLVGSPVVIYYRKTRKKPQNSSKHQEEEEEEAKKLSSTIIV